MLVEKRYCCPLTVSDFASRYLLCCEALATTKAAYAFTVFEQILKDFGLPSASSQAIRMHLTLRKESTKRN
jgi:putative transposase